VIFPARKNAGQILSQLLRGKSYHHLLFLKKAKRKTSVIANIKKLYRNKKAAVLPPAAFVKNARSYKIQTWPL
jgi:dihydroxyacetone kinase-like predicted kinase